MSLLISSIESLRARVRHLKADFDYWRELTGATAKLQQHNSQVQRITDTLSGTLNEAVSGTPIDPAAPSFGNASLRNLPKWRRDVGSIHLLWEFFRDKFAQRAVDTVDEHLGAGDDFAWACYKPFLDAAVDAGSIRAGSIKEPPLVFYSTDRFPFAQARTKMFHPPGLDSKDVGQFAQVLMNLPVPVIGMPWAVANRLPDLLVVGHEVGHVVAEDLRLAREAREALRAVQFPHDVGNERQRTWEAWSDEVFGDVFGVVTTGRAFVAALAAELASDVDQIREAVIDKQRPGIYPTPTLRMAICDSVLRRMGLTPSTAWSDVYQDLVASSREFKDDVDLVAQALLDRSWTALGGKKLTQILPWSPVHEANVEKVASAALAETIHNVPFSVRVWVAASMYASQKDAKTYANLALDQKLADFIVRRREDAVRSAHVSSLRSRSMPVMRGGRGPTPQEEREQVRADDESAGKEIARMLNIGAN